jgi:hypothetical protein
MLVNGFGIALVAFSVFVMAENIHRKGNHRAVEDKQRH